jgi:hypothetical protein
MHALVVDAQLQATTYQQPKKYWDAVARPSPEGQMFKDAADGEVKFMYDEKVVREIDCRTLRNNELVMNIDWVPLMKFDEHGNASRARMRLTPKGFEQQAGLDYDIHGITSPVAQRSTVLTILALIVKLRLKTRQYDVTKAFLMGQLKERICCKLPPGYNDPTKLKFGPHTVWELLRPIYGMKQASANFFTKLGEVLVSAGYVQLKTDSCVFYRRHKSGYIIFSTWVDDLLIGYSSEEMLAHLSDTLTAHFGIRDEGVMKYALGMNIEYDPAEGVMKLSHKSYLKKLMASNGFDKLAKHATAIPMQPSTKLRKEQCPSPEEYDAEMHQKFRQGLGGLVHLANWTHPEIAYAVSTLSQFMANPGKAHMDALVGLYKYVYGAADTEMIFRRRPRDSEKDPVIITLLSDADYAADVDTRRSRTGVAMYIDLCLMHWRSRLQQSVSLSTAESEFMALGDAVQSGIWLQNLLQELGIPFVEKTVIFCDNQAAVAIGHNPSHAKYAKHIDIRWFFVRDMVKAGRFDIVYINTDENIADIFTKALAKPKLLKFRDELFGTGPILEELIVSDLGKLRTITQMTDMDIDEDKAAEFGKR